MTSAAAFAQKSDLYSISGDASPRPCRGAALGRAVPAVLPLAAACLAPAAKRPRYLRPEQALAAFQLEPGLRIELVAAEPLVIDPVAFVFDEQGRVARSRPCESGWIGWRRNCRRRRCWAEFRGRLGERQAVALLNAYYGRTFEYTPGRGRRGGN